jgi:hypothetical protein
MGELPVDQGREAILVDDEVAEPKVAVNQARLGRRGRIGA